MQNFVLFRSMRFPDRFRHSFLANQPKRKKLVFFLALSRYFMYQVAENRELKKPYLVHFTKESIKSPYEIRQVGFFSWIGLETPYEHPRTSFLAFSGLTGFLTDVSSENKIFGSQPDFFRCFYFSEPVWTTFDDFEWFFAFWVDYV